MQKFDSECISEQMLRKLAYYEKLKRFRPENVARSCPVCAPLCLWVHAILQYRRAMLATVHPIRRQVRPSIPKNKS